jgi:hypothetical protein
MTGKRRAAGSGTGDTGDTLQKQTRSPPPAPPSGQEHAFASGRTRGRPGRPPGKPPRCPVCPRPRHARPSVPPPPRPVAPVRAHLAARTSRPVCRFLRRFRLCPRNPRESAGGSNPSPPKLTTSPGLSRRWGVSFTWTVLVAGRGRCVSRLVVHRRSTPEWGRFALGLIDHSDLRCG